MALSIKFLSELQRTTIALKMNQFLISEPK